MRFFHRTLDRVDIPLQPLRVTADFRLTIVASLLAAAALAVGPNLGSVTARALHERVIAYSAAGAFLVCGAVAVRSLASELHRVIRARTGPSHAGVMRLVITISGNTVLLLTFLGLIDVPVQHLLLGTAITGVIVGIAAQQALGNVFAGLVLLLARPFNIGDRVWIRSGSLGGEFVGVVTGMGMTYVTVRTEARLLSLPNAAVLSAAIGPAPALAGPAGADSGTPAAEVGGPGTGWPAAPSR